MDKLFTWEQWRMIFATSLSPVLAYLTPTAGFMYALVIMFAFNIWAGMRADGVAIVAVVVIAADAAVASNV